MKNFMNKICVILPVYGNPPNNYTQFLNSIVQNANFIDLLIVTDEKNKVINQSNIKTLHTSVEELGEKIQKAVKKIFNISIDTVFAERMQSNRYGLYKLTDYKFFYGDMFSEELREYAYWGFLDWDIILGDCGSVLPNFYDYDMIGTRGHFCCFKNTNKLYTIFKDENNWEWLNNNIQQNKHVLRTKLCDTTRSWLFDEHFVQPTLLKYSENPANNFKVFDTMKEKVICDVVHPHKKDNVDYRTNFYLYKNDNYANQYFLYKNGKIFRVSDEDNIKSEHLYVHLMGRSTLLENKINCIDISENLNFIIKPNYFELI